MGERVYSYRYVSLSRIEHGPTHTARPQGVVVFYFVSRPPMGSEPNGRAGAKTTSANLRPQCVRARRARWSTGKHIRMTNAYGKHAPLRCRKRNVSILRHAFPLISPVEKRTYSYVVRQKKASLPLRKNNYVFFSAQKTTVVCAINVNSHYLQTRGKNRFFVLCRPSRLVTMVNFSVTATDFYPKNTRFASAKRSKVCGVLSLISDGHHTNFGLHTNCTNYCNERRMRNEITSSSPTRTHTQPCS